MDTQSKSESNASGLASDLGAYVGKHPSEKVADLTFLEQPSVKAAVTATVPDTKVRDFVFHYNGPDARSEEHTSELQSLMRISYAVFCLKKKNKTLINMLLTNLTFSY